MEYTFRITEDEYLKILESEIRQKRKDPLSLAFVILFSVIQFALVVWLIAAGAVQGNAAAVLAIFSSALFAGMMIYQFCIGMQARYSLNKCKNAGYLYQDMDSLIRVKIKDGVLYVSGGKNNLSYDCCYFIKYETIGDVLALYFSNGQVMHRLLIPSSAFSGREESDSFANRISELSREIRTRQAEEPIEVEIMYSSTEKEFTDGFVSGCRTSYRTNYSLNHSMLLKIGLAFLLLWYVIRGTLGSAIWNVIACAGAFFLLYRPIAVFSPLLHFSAKKYVKTLFNGRETLNFTLTLTENCLIYKAEGFCNHFSMQQVACVEKTKKYLFVYLNGGVILFVPVTSRNSSSVSRGYLFLSEVALKNKASKVSFAALKKIKK